MKLFTISFKLLVILLTLCGLTFAQVRPVYDQGALGLGQLLRRMNTSASVMMIAAHPDDEDSALLAYLARGENARTAYLSLTRGDGGQNILGPELFESLGIIRTEELLQARRLDGAEQYFTRAFDYGFSKTLAEARAKWPEELILCDAVRAIRQFKPLVIISGFSGTPNDGHGQHQYAGYIAPKAAAAAADQAQCPNAGQPWKVQKFYFRSGFRATTPPAMSIPTGTYDPLLGRTYFQIAMEGRSQHKSQEQGLLELNGAQFSGLNPGEGTQAGKNIFDGLDTSIKGIAANTQNREEPLAAKFAELQDISAKVLREYNTLTPKNILPDLVKGYALAGSIRTSTRNLMTQTFAETKQNEFREAIRIAAGIQFEALADKETVNPGGAFDVNVKTFFPENAGIKLKEVKMKTPAGWPEPGEMSDVKPAQQQGFFRRETGTEERFYTIFVPANAEFTQPYWMKTPRDNKAYFTPRESDNPTLPFAPPEVTAEITMEVDGVDVTFSLPPQFRFAHPTRGELRRELNVVPKVSVSFDQKVLLVPTSVQSQKRYLSTTVTNNVPGKISGDIGFSLPTGFGTFAPPNQNSHVELNDRGETAKVTYNLSIKGGMKPGVYTLNPTMFLTGDKSYFESEMHTAAYPHIQTHRYYTTAQIKVVVLDLKTAPVKVGYISGSGDEMPEAIRQMGFEVTMLDGKELSSGDLSRFGTIVVGIRASETRPDFVANNARLMEFVKNGGTLLVQYQRPEFGRMNLLPFPAQLSPRVADENAKVTILDPAHPAFNFPNKITDADFAGWVQERNLYNLTNYGPEWKPLLEAHDEGENEDKGGLMVADVGKGKYVYCSYAFFRQLPAGVSGAYRLFANLISMSADKK